MKKNLFLAALAFVALASCTSDEFVGENSSPTPSKTEGAIQFGLSTGKVTRATSNDDSKSDAEKLDKQFKVYGVKSGTTAGSNLQKVFVNYGVWAIDGYTTSNSRGWEYVDERSEEADGYEHGSTDNSMKIKNQTIKYWDHSAADYRFVAGSPYSAFTFGINANTNVIETATVTGLAGHLNANPTSGSGTAIVTNPVYIADPLIISESAYSTVYGAAPVTLNFTRQQARVRVGIYETIPGYVIKEIHFYTSGSSTAETNSNVILTGAEDYFRGASNGTATITYSWSSTPSYTFTYDDSGTGATVTSAQNWYAGEFLSATPTNPATPAITAITSTGSGIWGTDKDMDANGYFTVIPTPSATTASPLLIKCDYVLLSEKDNSGETITVTGATAAIPAAFSKWNSNTSYTYLFKISNNTNGSTGNDKVGLYPITFDAVVVAETAGTEQGTITTVSTPSITTYQEGSVIASGIEYVKGKAITVTVTNDAGEVQTLNKSTAGVGYVQVYSLGTTAVTEADLQVNPPTSGGLSIDITDDVLSFTPSDAGYYAVMYQISASPVAYAYKVIQVVNAHASTSRGGLR